MPHARIAALAAAAFTFAFALPSVGFLVAVLTGVGAAWGASCSCRAVRDRQHLRASFVTLAVLVLVSAIVVMPLMFETTRRRLASSVLALGAVPHADVRLGFLDRTAWDFVIAPFDCGGLLLVAVGVIARWSRAPSMDDGGLGMLLCSLAICAAAGVVVFMTANGRRDPDAARWALTELSVLLPVGLAGVAVAARRLHLRRRFYMKLLRGELTGYRTVLSSDAAAPALFRSQAHFCNAVICRVAPDEDARYRTGTEFAGPLARVFIQR